LNRLIVSDNTLTVDRDGKEVVLAIPENLLGQLADNKKKGKITLIEPRIPAIVYIVPDTSKAYKAGLRANDQFVSIDSFPAMFFDELKTQLMAKKNKNVLVTVIRNNEQVKFQAPINAEGQIGFIPYGAGPDYAQMDSLKWLKLNVKKYSFFAAFPAGIRKTGEKLSDYINQFKKIVNPKTGGFKLIGGFRAIGKAFPNYWSWEAFWNITAFLSVILAFMNLLPIPALDGGHVMFTLYEMVSGRKPNEKFMEYAQVAGMILLLLLMLYANGNDWFGWGK
jgi:regulator of sigma E protease